VTRKGLPRGFEIAKEGGWTIVARGAEMDVARAFVARHRPELSALFGRERGAGRGVAAGRGAIVQADLGGRAVMMKALRRGGLPGRIGGGSHGWSRLLAEMRILEEAAGRGVPTARLAFGATAPSRRGRTSAILGTFRVEGAVSLAVWMERIGPEDPRRRERGDLLARAGGAVRRAHDLGLDHADLNIGNVLVRAGNETDGAWVIDLGLSRLGSALPPGKRASNLVRLLRSAEKHLGGGAVRARDAAAFVRGYLASPQDPDRAIRRALLRAIRRRLPALALHRLGWALRGGRA
jgi:tRNA A-37 threonylcarbamoyl transferase component Bud32